MLGEPILLLLIPTAAADCSQPRVLINRETKRKPHPQ